MGIEIIHDGEVGCFACNTTDVVFGPRMVAPLDVIEGFLNALPDDPRNISSGDLDSLWHLFREFPSGTFAGVAIAQAAKST